MAESRLQQRLLTNTFRSFRRSAILRESKSTETTSTIPKNLEKKENEDKVILPGSKRISESPLGPVTYVPKTLDKLLLVWHKEYKSVSEVPYKIRQEKMAYIHSKSRIRIANILMILALCGCVWAVWSGKNEAARGETLQKKILEQNKKIREDYLAELEKNKST